MMYLALTYDHRLLDGKDAVLFLKRIQTLVENPKRMLFEIWLYIKHYFLSTKSKSIKLINLVKTPLQIISQFFRHFYLLDEFYVWLFKTGLQLYLKSLPFVVAGQFFNILKVYFLTLIQHFYWISGCFILFMSVIICAVLFGCCEIFALTSHDFYCLLSSLIY